jgi:outer membrane lipoprotein-sorting protein
VFEEDDTHDDGIQRLQSERSASESLGHAEASMADRNTALIVRCTTVMLLFAASLGAHAQGAPGSEDPARSIVEKADQVRFPQEGFEAVVTISSRSGEERAEPRRYRVFSKGNDSTIVLTEEPAVDRGQAMLMRGRDLWVFLPNVSQPVRLSLSQRLTGLVANGDLARANFSGDYQAQRLREETIDGETYDVLQLTAVDRGVTYGKVLYWVRQSNAQPLKAEFYSASDRLLKTCRYENYRLLAGRVRPTRLVLTDALRGGEESVLEYTEMSPRELPEKMFTKDYLKRL